MKKLFSTLLLAMFAMTMMADETPSDNNLLSISPADGSTLTGLASGEYIKFKTAYDTYCGGVDVTITDQEKSTVLYHTFTTSYSTEDGWSFKIYSDLEFQKGHTYTITLQGHADSDVNSPTVGDVITATYIGDGAEYGYSSITYKIAPEDGDEITDKNANYAIINFKGGQGFVDKTRSKIVDGEGTTHDFLQINDIDNEHTIWQFLIPVSILENCTSTITLNIYAKDADGLVVKGNAGIDEDSHISVTYICTMGYPDVTVSPATGNVNSLKEFVFSCEDGITVKDASAEVTLYKEDMVTAVQAIKGSDITAHTSDTHAMVGTLAESLRTEGTYYLHVPAGVFGLGSNSLDNREAWIKYTIVDRIKAYGVTIDPTDGSTVTSLSEITITFDEWNAAIPYYNNKENITVTNANGAVVTEAKATIDQNRTKVNQCIIKLNTPITANGSYKLNVPNKAFILGQAGNNTSSAMYFEFIVQEGPEQPVSVTISTTQATDNSLSEITLSFDDYSYVGVTSEGLEVSILDATGAEVAKGTLKEGQAWKELCVTVNSGYNITTAGIYTVRIPAGYVRLGSTVHQKVMNIQVPFNTSTGIELPEVDAADTIKVYDMQGRLVRETKQGEALTGLHGLYIVNGKKVMAK